MRVVSKSSIGPAAFSHNNGHDSVSELSGAG